MRPVDLIPQALQAPNVERTGQQQALQPSIAQQAFAQQLQRTAGERPTLVQAPQGVAGARASLIDADERGERRPERKRGRARRPGTEPAPAGPASERGAGDAAVEPGTMLDITV